MTNQTENDKSGKSQKIQIALMGVLLIIIIFLGIKIISTLCEYRHSAKLYEETADNYVIVEKNSGHSEEKSDNTDTETAKQWYEYVSVDLEGLSEINPDVVGWIYFENEDISYPIVCSGDNTKYLRMAYNGENMDAGSIFMDGNNASDFSDVHTIIYGHNMKDLSMFGRLKYYKTDDGYWEEHKYFQIITDDKKYRYEIFAYKEVSDTSEIYRTFVTGNEDFYQFVVNVIRMGNYLDSERAVNYDDHVITLSTCTSASDRRFVVSAVRVDEH
jgi:SrtB family sortase